MAACLSSRRTDVKALRLQPDVSSGSQKVERGQVRLFMVTDGSGERAAPGARLPRPPGSCSRRPPLRLW